MNNIKKNKFHLLIFLIIIAVIIVPFINYSRIYSEENSTPSLTITEGVASGDVTSDSVIIWSRVNKPSIMNVEFANNSLFLNSKLETKWVDNTTDFTGNIKLGNLSAATKYFYHVFFSTIDNNITSSSIMGTFKTAPNAAMSRNSISFIIGGDIGGQTFCRELNIGYSIFEKMTELAPDFYIQKSFQGYFDLHPVVALDNHHQHRSYLHFECKSQVLAPSFFQILNILCLVHGKMFDHQHLHLL